MRILHVIPGFDIRGGGGNRACGELCESLAALGHEVSIYHVKNDDARCFTPKGVEVRAFASRVLNRYAYSPQLRKCLERKIPEADIVHIHATWQYPSIPASRISLRHNVPYVIQPHGNLHPWKLNHKAVRKKTYWYLIEKEILKNAVFIHVESNSDQEDVKALLPEVKTVISPCAVYSNLFENMTNPGYVSRKWTEFQRKKCLLYLARVDVNKGIDLLLKAYAEVLKSNNDYKLLIVGPDYANTTERMKKLDHDLGISENVVWAGMVSDEERVWIMQDCDIYALPSLSENFGISVLEAMFCSKPVLTTTATPWKELSETKSGVIVEPTAEGIYQGLQTMLGMTAEQLKTMGSKAKTLAKQKYEWSVIAQQMVDHYQVAIEEYHKCAK